MKRKFNQYSFVVIIIVFISTSLFFENEAKAASIPPTPPVKVALWWEIPFQPPEKWLSPKWEDDEWYKNRQQKKYRERT